VEDLVTIIQNVKNEKVDFIMGSRWVEGGGVRNWDWSRILLSRAGNLYARLLLGGHFRDWTGGFNFWRKNVLLALQITTLESQGYAFQIEMKYRAFRLNFLGFEVPIVFEERRQGQSKMSLQIILEALLRVWKLKSKFQVN
jgi:dolichol-phosphate mannosyltransferase